MKVCTAPAEKRLELTPRLPDPIMPFLSSLDVQLLLNLNFWTKKTSNEADEIVKSGWGTLEWRKQHDYYHFDILTYKMITTLWWLAKLFNQERYFDKGCFKWDASYFPVLIKKLVHNWVINRAQYFTPEHPTKEQCTTGIYRSFSETFQGLGSPILLSPLPDLTYQEVVDGCRKDGTAFLESNWGRTVVIKREDAPDWFDYLEELENTTL